MPQNINLTARFKAEICTFETAKKAKASGMTCANTYYAYDEKGELNNGGWLDGIFDDYSPAIQFPFAVTMLEDIGIDIKEILLYQDDQDGGKFYLIYRKELLQSRNLVDVLVHLWLIHKK